MKNLIAAVVVTFACGALAQEIGTEISPSTPEPNKQNPPVSNPWGAPPPPPKDAPPPPPPPSAWGAPAPAPEPGKTTAGPKAEETGLRVAAGSGSFGFRAGFGGGAMPGIPTGAAAVVAAPTIGLSIFAGDNAALLVDLGFGTALTNNFLMAIDVALGVNLYFKPPTSALRPFFTILLDVQLFISNNTDFALAAKLGGGAEYFFSPHFSMAGQMLIAAPMRFPNGNFVLGIFTLTPGVTASWYF